MKRRLSWGRGGNVPHVAAKEKDLTKSLQRKSKEKKTRKVADRENGRLGING